MWQRIVGMQRVKEMSSNCSSPRERTSTHKTITVGLPRHYGVGGRQQDVIGLLLTKRASMSVKDADGRTPLDWAEIQGDKEVLDLLRRPGAK
jgi:ankyrin repeat protein